MLKHIKEEVFEIDTLKLLDCSELSFSLEDSGFLTLTYKGETYNKVNLTRLIPFKSKTTYISVHYENAEKEFKEIGVIKDTEELSTQQKEVVETFLEFKYYMPEITKVYSIKDNMRGSIFIKLECTSGEKTICVHDWYSNFKLLNKNYLYVVDVHGNKYCCKDIYTLDRKSLSCVELFV